MKNSYITWIIAAVIVIGGGYWLMNQQSPSAQPVATPATNATTNTTPTATTTDTTQATPTAPMAVTVTYGPNGFSPSTVTIAKGGTVSWVSVPGADELWVASNPHPTHEGYDGTTKSTHCAAGYTGAKPFDQCAVGTTYSFTFNQTGSWGYHNHGNHGDTGTVIVQ